jgi:hypothetical protein
MSNIQDIRDQLRSDTGSKPGFLHLARRIVAAIAMCVAVSGLVYSLFFRVTVVPLSPSASLPTFHRVNPDGTPQQSPSAPQPSAPGTEAPRRGTLVPLPPSAVLPTFHRVNPDGTPQQSPSAPRPVEAPPDPARYAGLSPRQTGKVADEVCFARAHARVPHWSKTPRLTTKELHDFDFDEMPHFNELLNCLLTEAPARYCSSSQRSMITAEIAMYFRGMEYGNNTLAKAKADIIAARQAGRIERQFGPDPDLINRINRRELIADPRVVSAIEARLRDGTLTASDRDKFSAAALPPLRQRFASVKPSTRACPAQPWWAFWRDR